jgi:hypothetical protein
LFSAKLPSLLKRITLYLYFYFYFYLYFIYIFFPFLFSLAHPETSALSLSQRPYGSPFSMSFGWSAGDIFALVQVCYKVVENCTDGLVSALIQVSNLRQEVREFGQALEHLQVHLTEAHELAYLNFDPIEKTLKNCNDWLERYKQLQRPDEHSTILGTSGGEKTRIWRAKPKDLREVGVRAGQALRYNAWGGSDELQALQTALARHRQTLVLYLQILER